MRVAVFSPDEIEIEDTWDVSGLRGTGSHHVRADDVFVPAARTLAMLEDEPCIDEPLLRIPVPTLYSLPVASVALGIARGRSTTSWTSPRTRSRCSTRPRWPGACRSRSTWRWPTAAAGRSRARLRRGRRAVDDGGRGVAGQPGATGPGPRCGGVGDVAGRRGGDQRLQGRRRQLAVRRQPAAAPAARRQRRDAALPGQTGHARHGRRRPGRPGRRPDRVLGTTADHASVAVGASRTGSVSGPSLVVRPPSDDVS